MDIKRFGFKYIGGNDYEWEGEQPNGEYCYYSDYEDMKSSKDAEIARLNARLERVWNEVLNQAHEVVFQCSPNMGKIEDAFNDPE